MNLIPPCQREGRCEVTVVIRCTSFEAFPLSVSPRPNDTFLSLSASANRPHLLQPLHPPQPINTLIPLTNPLLPHNLNIQLPHTRNHDPHTLKKAIDGDSQHPIRRGSVVCHQYCLLLYTRLCGYWSGGEGGSVDGVAGERKGTSDEGREFGVDGDGAEGDVGEAVGWEGDAYCSVRDC